MNDRTTHFSYVSVDDGVLAFEQHSRSRCPSGCCYLLRAYGNNPEFEVAREKLADLRRDTDRSLRTQPP
jgi:hypothetical protein